MYSKLLLWLIYLTVQICSSCLYVIVPFLFQVKMAELMDQVRDMALSETTKNKVQLCVLLEVIEAHASEWQLSKEVADYYCNTLGDLMANM